MDAYLIVDPDARTIEVPEVEKVFGVYGDNNAERKYFKCPRIVGNKVDLSKCYIYVNYISAATKVGQIMCDIGDVDGVDTSGEEIVFSWPITRNVLDKNESTNLFFAVQAKTTTGDTVFTTRKAEGFCYESIEGTEAVAEEYADIVLQLISRMDNVEANIGEQVAAYFKENPAVTAEYLDQTLQPVKNDVSQLKEDLVELNEYNIEYTNNILDISDKNILNGYGIKLNGGNCLTDINSCLIENSERLAFKNPVKIENGIYYKVCNSDGVNEVAGNSWESYLQYVGVYDENGDYITRIENSTFGFFINGKSFRQYTNSLYTKYKDYELSKIPSYVLVSATKVNKKYVKQLRKSTNEAERITNFVPYKLSLIEKNTLQIKKNTLQIEKNTAVIKELQSNNGNNGIRLLFVSDLHYYTEHPEHLEGGVPERDRMQMLIDAVNAENQKKKVNALFILGDFERGYGKKSAEYFSEHYASQLQMPYYAIAGDHDFYTSGEWESIWGYGREYTVDISNLRFIIVDVYKDTIGVKENNATVVSSLDEENQIERINQALSENKLPIILCHYDNGIIGDKTTKNWRNYIRSNVKAVFRAHTHNVVINNNGYGDLLYYTVGNFSYPPDANWENINDKNGNPTNRWSFRELYAEGEKYVTRQIYPRQTITVNEKITNYDYSMSEKSVVL